MPISTIGSNSLNQTSDLTINGQTVGKGGGNVATNTAHGASALQANTSGGGNTALGYQAGYSNQTQSNTTAIGYQAGYTNTGDNELVAVGYKALFAATTGTNNTALGHNTLAANTTGSHNLAVGSAALTANTTGSYNTAIGRVALVANTTGIENTAVGYQALVANTTASYNTAVGRNSLVACTTGTHNTVIGHNSGDTITTGTKNTILGRYNGNQGGLDIRTSSNNIVLSDGDGNPRAYWDSANNRWTFGTSSIMNLGGTSQATVFRSGADGSGIHFSTNAGYPANELGTVSDNTEAWGAGSHRWTVIYATTGTINTSDRQQKQDIQDLSSAELAVAQEIKTLFKTFRWKDAVIQKGEDARIHVGVIAQDVQAAFARQGLDASRYALWCSDTWYEVDGAGINDATGTRYTAESEGAVEKTRLGIRYDQLLAFVIAAM